MSLAADQLSAQDVKSIVDAAVGSQSQGATRAEVEAAIRSATSAQLSAAEVQKIVDASVAGSQGPTAAEDSAVGAVRGPVRDGIGHRRPALRDGS